MSFGGVSPKQVLPVERLITARLPLSELRVALQMVADRTTLRTILIPDQD